MSPKPGTLIGKQEILSRTEVDFQNKLECKYSGQNTVDLNEFGSVVFAIDLGTYSRTLLGLQPKIFDPTKINAFIQYGRQVQPTLKRF